MSIELPSIHSNGEWNSGMFRLAQQQFLHAANLIDLDENIKTRLLYPQRTTIVSFPFRRDDYDDVETVFGYRVQHTLTMGPTKGGIRYHEDVNLSWLLRLMGYELACVPVSRVRHDYFLSMHPEKLELLERNREAMLRAYLQTKTRRGLIGWRALTESILWLYSGLRGPRFLRAKWRARAWVHQNEALILQRRKLAERLRIRSDAEVLAPMIRSYPLRQVLKLAGERGAPRRPLS